MNAVQKESKQHIQWFNPNFSKQVYFLQQETLWALTQQANFEKIQFLLHIKSWLHNVDKW